MCWFIYVILLKLIINFKSAFCILYSVFCIENHVIFKQKQRGRQRQRPRIDRYGLMWLSRLVSTACRANISVPVWRLAAYWGTKESYLPPWRPSGKKVNYSGLKIVWYQHSFFLWRWPNLCSTQAVDQWDEAHSVICFTQPVYLSHSVNTPTKTHKIVAIWASYGPYSLHYMM